VTVLLAHVRVGRGQGLGNRMFPWARARVFCEAQAARMLAPSWARLAIGPILRGGVDLRDYRGRFMLHGVFRPREDDVGAVLGVLRRARGRVVTEPEDLTSRFEVDPADGRPTIVRFEGYRRFFGPLVTSQVMLARELPRIVHPRHRVEVERLPDVPIALHVRCGPDFPQAATSARLAAGEATPLSWFLAALRLVRRAAGRDVAAYVVSDGSTAQLRPLLAEPSVVHFRGRSAITDLLLLAKARVLLASGSSSFSAWGAFLGRMPAVSHPGQPLTEWRLASTRDQLLAELDPADPAPEVLARFREATSGASS
jgi:hypothetical protein